MKRDPALIAEQWLVAMCGGTITKNTTGVPVPVVRAVLREYAAGMLAQRKLARQIKANDRAITAMAGDLAALAAPRRRGIVDYRPGEWETVMRPATGHTMNGHGMNGHTMNGHGGE